MLLRVIDPHCSDSPARGAEVLCSDALRLCSEVSLTRTVARWLVQRGHRDPNTVRKFLDPRLSDLNSPENMADRDKVSQRVAQSIRAGETIAVFGDYDCDGITSAAIMTEVIRALGGRAEALVASRFEGGYGVSAAAVERIAKTGARLLVTCDCGSSDHDSLAELGRRGIESVVIDHHLVPDRPLPVVGFLNPHRPECEFPYKGMASCGLALSVAAALRKEFKAKLDIRRWLDLVAVGTIADVAPLDGDNRRLVRAGLDSLRRPQRPGLDALLEQARLTGESPIGGRDVAFRIAPHINAPGRLGSAEVALRLLLAKERGEAQALAKQLSELSARRRELQEQMVEQAVSEIEENGYAEQAAIVVGREGWSPGIVGIVAGRLADRYGKATIAIGFDEPSADDPSKDPEGRGSARGPAGSRLHEALTASEAALIRFGGHQAAAGLEIKRSKLKEFRELFCRAVSDCPPRADSSAPSSLPLDPRDNLEAVLADLDRLEPCGERNPRPQLEVRGRVISARAVKGGHLKLSIALPSGGALGGFAVNQGERAPGLSGEIGLIGDLRHNTFPGAAPVEMFVESIVD